MPITNRFRFMPSLWSRTIILGLMLAASTGTVHAELTITSSRPDPLGEKLQEISSRAANLSNRASELALQAIATLGIHYKFGGNTPESGLDCSGLVRYVFKQAWGAVLPRTSEEISHVGERVDKHDMQPGDLVFYNTLKRGFSHVGIYLGDNKFIHSPSPGGQVRIESMDLSYWKNRFNGARRIEHTDTN